MLPCPTCGGTIEARNDQLGIAACGQSGGLFEWPLLPLPAAPIAGPASVIVDRRDGSIRAIRWRGNRVGAVLAAVVVVALSVTVMHVPWLALSVLLGLGSLLWKPLSRAAGIRIV